MIKLNTVTWYSQIAAIVLGLLILLLGIYIGIKIEQNRGEVEEVI